VLLALVSIMPARAQSSTADQLAMQRVVEAQLDAFANDREIEAYSYAAPLVQQIFPNVERFMAMVKGGYQPVYRNTAREFVETSLDAMGRQTVRMRLTGLDGKRYEALYAMERQPDGSWKIAGCALIAIPGLDA
jgi:ribosomal protein L17